MKPDRQKRPPSITPVQEGAGAVISIRLEFLSKHISMTSPRWPNRKRRKTSTQSLNKWCPSPEFYKHKNKSDARRVLRTSGVHMRGAAERRPGPASFARLWLFVKLIKMHRSHERSKRRGNLASVEQYVKTILYVKRCKKHPWCMDLFEKYHARSGVRNDARRDAQMFNIHLYLR